MQLEFKIKKLYDEFSNRRTNPLECADKVCAFDFKRKKM